MKISWTIAAFVVAFLLASTQTRAQGNMMARYQQLTALTRQCNAQMAAHNRQSGALIMSGHTMGPPPRCSNYMNRWLAEMGYLEKRMYGVNGLEAPVSRAMQRQQQESINTPGSTNHQIDQVVRGVTTTEGGHEVQMQGRGNYYWNCRSQNGEVRHYNTQSSLSPGSNCTRIP
jgi:hypothetical protein